MYAFKLELRGTMMPFASECCKCSKLPVDLFQESYINSTTHNGILKNWNFLSLQNRTFKNLTVLKELISHGQTSFDIRCFKCKHLAILQAIASFTKEGLAMQKVECIRESDHVTDCYSVAVEVIVRHLQRNVSFILFFK